MKKNILNLNGIKILSKKQQGQTLGGHLTGIGDSKSHITWRCFRNDSGNRYFFSPVDLSSATTVCYPFDNSVNAPTHPTSAEPHKPI
ncbi:hypothetical protein [Tenacibaculum jejuense]|uniref:hypothetical protein n=1 Tax=Tenacibaculum jejuense TaxID=584609 RepID=UPI000BA38350|nr:hypothetical protein [Tenacibaculum jejuense]